MTRALARVLATGAALLLAVPAAAADGDSAVLPALARNLVVYYDFDHPAGDDAAREMDRGLSRTPLELVNGGAAMRVEDAAYARAGRALETRQAHPDRDGNDDWKAGNYDASGLPSLSAFNAVTGVTLMGWVKPTGQNPAPDSTTPAPADTFGAVGLFGILSGTSDGHLVRALIEVIDMGGTYRLVALGRREDGGESLLLAADGDWRAALPANEWTHVAATFDYDEGVMALYRNGEPLAATYASEDDRWRVAGAPEPDRTSATDSAGIKIGGSYPQNTVERNPFNGRFDDLMFFDRSLTSDEVRAQFLGFAALTSAPARE